MVGFDPIDGARREALEHRRSAVLDERRLGRELEQGFKDDSEEEEREDEETDDDVIIGTASTRLPRARHIG